MSNRNKTVPAADKSCGFHFIGDCFYHLQTIFFLKPLMETTFIDDSKCSRIFLFYRLNSSCAIKEKCTLIIGPFLLCSQSVRSLALTFPDEMLNINHID